MSKKKSIAEPILYTAEELDTIHSIIGDSCHLLLPTSTYNKHVVKRMTILGTNLHTLLVHAGYICTYQLSKKHYSQIIEMQLTSGSAYRILLQPSRISIEDMPSSGYFPSSLMSIQELMLQIPHIHATKYRQHQITEQCRSCHYSNNAGEFCGIGLDLMPDCTLFKTRI